MFRTIKSFWNAVNHAISVNKYGEYFYGIGGATGTTISTSGVQAQKAAYEKCPAVAAIINRKSRAFSNGKWFILDAKGKGVNTSDVSVSKVMLLLNPKAE